MLLVSATYMGYKYWDTYHRGNPQQQARRRQSSRRRSSTTKLLSSTRNRERLSQGDIMQHQLEEEEEGIEVEDGQELYPQARPSFAEFVTEQVILPFQPQQPDQPERKKSIYGMLVFPNDDDDDDDDNNNNINETLESQEAANAMIAELGSVLGCHTFSISSRKMEGRNNSSSIVNDVIDERAPSLSACPSVVSSISSRKE